MDMDMDNNKDKDKRVSNLQELPLNSISPNADPNRRRKRAHGGMPLILESYQQIRTHRSMHDHPDVIFHRGSQTERSSRVKQNNQPRAKLYGALAEQSYISFPVQRLLSLNDLEGRAYDGSIPTSIFQLLKYLNKTSISNPNLLSQPEDIEEEIERILHLCKGTGNFYSGM